MKKINVFYLIFILCFLLIQTKNCYSQNVKNNNKYTIGVNLSQLSALTIELNYEYHHKPYLDLVGNIGYSFNHIHSKDINSLIIPHIDCGNNGVEILNQTGGFIKLGVKLNARRSFQKRNYFFLGANLINSVVYEKADFSNYCDYGFCPIDNINIDDPINNHTKYIFAFGTWFGYSFKIWKMLQIDLGLQLAFPYNNYKSLYAYRNFIPGIGFKDAPDYFFPTIIINLKF